MHVYSVGMFGQNALAPSYHDKNSFNLIIIRIVNITNTDNKSKSEKTPLRDSFF